MSSRDRAGLVIKIVTNGTLDPDIADIFEKYGPCDALKGTADFTVDGTPAEASDETTTAYPADGHVWDPVGWSAITAITTSGNVWAAWYSRVDRSNS